MTHGRKIARSLARAFPWFALLCAFILFAIWVRQQIPASIYRGIDTEVYSFDFLGYAHQLSDINFLGYGRFRHPLWGWLMMPVAVTGHRILSLGEEPYWLFLFTVFACNVHGYFCHNLKVPIERTQT